jgi:small GTP-binding protein
MILHRSLYIDESFVKLQIWDTAGQERFRGITKSYYKGANAVILVYDISSPKSFEDVMNFWTKETRQYSP